MRFHDLMQLVNEYIGMGEEAKTQMEMILDAPERAELQGHPAQQLQRFVKVARVRGVVGPELDVLEVALSEFFA